MFILIEYGDNENLIVNPNCSAKILTDYIVEKCRLPKTAVIDLTDENAVLTDMYAKDPMENARHWFVAKNTYLLCTIEINEDKSIKKITPSLNEWEKKYPFLERKLRHRDKKAKQEEEQATNITGSKKDATIKASSIHSKKSVGGKKKKKQG